MTQNIATISAQLPSFLQGHLGAHDIPNELEENVRGSYAVVSVKGKVFAIKFGGETQQLLNEQGFPAQYFDCVLVAANGHLNKTYYATTFNDDAAERPDCWSDDGVRPAATNPVAPLCATCPKNVFGSRISDNGSKGKACSDTRKTVILPIDNLQNERFGGGMMLRISPTGLQELAAYNKKLRASNVPYYAVVTRLTFDSTLAYPKLVFTAQRYLTEAEFAVVTEARENEHTKHILESGYVEAAPEVDTFTTVGNQLGAPPAHAVEAPAAPKKATRTRAAAQPELPQPAQQDFIPAGTNEVAAPVVEVPEALSQKLNNLFG